MKIEDIKREIAELATKHQSEDEFQFAEMIEEEAEGLIVAFCEYSGYQVKGFPVEKRKLFEKQEEIDGEQEDEYFCRERFQLYLDCLALENDDVAEIWYFYNNTFWPGTFQTKETFLEFIKDQIAPDNKKEF